MKLKVYLSEHPFKYKTKDAEGNGKNRRLTMYSLNTENLSFFADLPVGVADVFKTFKSD